MTSAGKRIQKHKTNYVAHMPRLVVFVVMVLLLVLNHSVFALPGGGRFMPWLVAAGVFCWAVFNPSFLRWPTVLLLGLMQDFVVGTPLGVYALGLLVVYRLTLQQRKFLLGRPFKVVWLGFAVELAAAMLVQTVVLYVIDMPITVWLPVTWAMSVVLFPPVYLLMRAVHRPASEQVF